MIRVLLAEDQRMRAPRRRVAHPDRRRASPIVSCVRTPKQGKGKLLLESATLGLGYACVLIWVGSALMGSFGWADSTPYWSVIPRLRTDTIGFLAFAVSIVTLVVSKYLQLQRQNGAAPPRPAVRPAGVLVLQSVAEVAALLGTGLVIYLSCNAFMHPSTLKIQLTHLLPWPSEGTVRVLALGACWAGVAVRRYLRSTGGQPGTALATAQEKEVAAV